MSRHIFLNAEGHSMTTQHHLPRSSSTSGVYAIITGRLVSCHLPSRMSGKDDEALASRMAATMENLARLCLCRLPRTDHFDKDVQRIAEYAHGNAEVVAERPR